MTAPMVGQDAGTGLIASHRPSWRFMTVIFVSAAGLASALLFIVEPLAVRMMLPLLGGSPAVWNTAMVFFQMALLIGYLIAHVVRQRLSWSAGPWLQIGLVALAVVVLPVTIPSGWAPPQEGQAIWVLTVLLVMLGLPFVALSMLGPTLQGWFADTSHPQRDEPYFLYAASNVGAVIGLLGYPFLIEPLVGLRDQARTWAIGYLLLLGLLGICAVLRHRHPAVSIASVIEGPPAQEVAQDRGSVSKSPHDTPSEDSPAEDVEPDRRIGWRRKGEWVLLAAVPSGLLLAVTQHISTDVASIPLLWVAPLTIYLATFVVAFGQPRAGCPPSLGRIALIAVIPLAATLSFGSRWLIPGLILHLAAFAVLALAVHFELAGRRPAPEHLTGYFLWISVGGLLGGVGVALVAPMVFNRITEYPLLLIAVLMVLWWVPFTRPESRKSLPVYVGLLTATLVALFALDILRPWTLVAGVVAIGGSATYLIAEKRRRVFIATMAGVLAIMALVTQPSLFQDRSFFGVLRVFEMDGLHVLVSGSTVHGAQTFHPEINTEPKAYYQRDTGIGRLVSAATSGDVAQRVAVVGLGAGTLATYGGDTDRFEFFEIDQSVLDIAEDTTLFTYLADSEARVKVRIIDGRIGLQEASGTFDQIVLDAFSSDAIPIHLLTREALDIYLQKLSPGGVVAIHVTNKYFDLKPTVARLGAEFGLDAHVYETSDSVWMVLSPNGSLAEPISEELTHWTLVPAHAGTSLWTDDYANLLSTLKGF